MYSVVFVWGKGVDMYGFVCGWVDGLLAAFGGFLNGLFINGGVFAHRGFVFYGHQSTPKAGVFGLLNIISTHFPHHQQVLLHL